MKNSICIYYGDCKFITNDCQETEPHYLCKYRKIRSNLDDLNCADYSCEQYFQPCEACPNNQE